MSDRRLQVFQAVARMLSFSKAADQLSMTQPAVTFQVRQLEDQFDTRLFNRAHNRVTLTEAGHVALEYADKIFEMYAEMDNAVSDITGSLSGSLTLGASTTISEYLLPVLLGEFNAKKPEVLLRLRVSNTNGIISMVENNVIDLGVVEGPISNKSLVVDVCRQDELVVVVPSGHALAKESAVTFKKVLEYSFICREEGSGTRDVINDYLNNNGFDKHALKGSLELGSPESIKGAIEAGMGVSVLSAVSIEKELKLGTLKAIPLKPALTRDFSFVRKPQKFRVRRMEELLAFAKSHCEKTA